MPESSILSTRHMHLEVDDREWIVAFVLDRLPGPGTAVVSYHLNPSPVRVRIGSSALSSISNVLFVEPSPFGVISASVTNLHQDL